MRKGVRREKKKKINGPGYKKQETRYKKQGTRNTKQDKSTGSASWLRETGEIKIFIIWKYEVWDKRDYCNRQKR